MRNEGFGHIDPSWCGYACVLWNPAFGCPLEFEYRPAEGAHLVPNYTHQCQLDDPKNNKKGVAIAWAPYHDVIYKAMYSDDIRIPDNLNIDKAIQNLKDLMVQSHID